jgi:hypothetical protein
MTIRPPQPERLAGPDPTGEAATAIGEALIFLRREAASAGLPELAESLTYPIDTAVRLAAAG